MSFFELDGGAKKKAKKSTKPKATKKAPAKKTSGKKKTKKGGNFLGTVSELFAPAGWENFVTAAGLLALDRTDNYLRKSKKDSKKQRGGADEDTPYEEMDTDKMTGGARKRSSSRKQRGGSDGHHTIEYLDAVGGEDEMNPQTDNTSQTGGAKKKAKSKGKGKKGHRGGAMTYDEKNSFLSTYHREPEEAKQLIQIYDSVKSNNSLMNNNQSTRANKIIRKVIETHTQSVVPAQAPAQAQAQASEATIGTNNLNQSIQQQAFAAQRENELFGGKKSKSKAKSSTKKPKAKKSASKRK